MGNGRLERLVGASLLGLRDENFGTTVAFYLNIDGVGAKYGALARRYVADKPRAFGEVVGVEGGVAAGKGGGGRFHRAVGAAGGAGRRGHLGLGGLKFGGGRAAVVGVGIGAVAAGGCGAVNIHVVAFANKGVCLQEAVVECEQVVFDGRLVANASRIAIEYAAVKGADTNHGVVARLGYSGGIDLLGATHLLANAGVGGVEAAVGAVEQVPVG